MNNPIIKYNVQAPRYTSYPTVPYWDTIAPTVKEWEFSVKNIFDKTNSTEGISVYIHLPYCESLCTYCGCNTRITVNHGVEEPYITAVLQEWKAYLKIFNGKPVIKEIHLGGGTPTFFSPENLRKLIEGILHGAELHPAYEFSLEAHPNNTRLCHLKTLYNLGFKRLSLGIQDFDLNVQKIINRIQPVENVERVVNIARDIGYTSINFDLIYGLPLQTRKSIINTITQVKKLRPDRIAFYSYAHVPWIKPGQRKFSEADLPVDVEKRALYELGKSMFKESGYEEIGMDHFALKSDSLFEAAKEKKLHRNFMGYTNGKTHLMVGLGVSSISDSWNAFVQNEKTVEKYLELIGNNQLPFFKGHMLTQDDLIIRKHILNIMCNMQTSWDEEEYPVVCDAIEKLREMERDNLLEIRPFEIKIKKQGRPFLRNVCMAFDKKLWENTPRQNIFSSAI